MAYVARTHLTEEECDKILMPLKERMTIWKVGLYYGSMVYFEMGEKKLSKKNEEIGEFNLTLNCDEWYLRKNNVKVCDSFTITREFAENNLGHMMFGEKFDDFDIDIQSKITTIYFKESYQINLFHDNTIEMDQYHTLFSLRLQKEKYISLLQGKLPRLEMEVHKQD
jgi:hypothetical protein